MFRLRNVLNDNPVFSSLMTYHRVCNKSNTTGTTSVAGIVYPSGAHEYILVFIIICPSVNFYLAIALPDYIFGILKLLCYPLFVTVSVAKWLSCSPLVR